MTYSSKCGIRMERWGCHQGQVGTPVGWRGRRSRPTPQCPPSAFTPPVSLLRPSRRRGTFLLRDSSQLYVPLLGFAVSLYSREGWALTRAVPDTIENPLHRPHRICRLLTAVRHETVPFSFVQ